MPSTATPPIIHSSSYRKNSRKRYEDSDEEDEDVEIDFDEEDEEEVPLAPDGEAMEVEIEDEFPAELFAPPTQAEQEKRDIDRIVAHRRLPVRKWNIPFWLSLTHVVLGCGCTRATKPSH